MFKNKFILLNNFKNNNGQFLLRNDYKIINSIISKLLIVFLLITNFYLLHQNKNILLKIKENKRKDDNKNDNKNEISLNDHESIMGEYSLYNLYKYDQISLIIYGIINWKVNDSNLLNFIDCLKKQTLKELQIIFIMSTNLNSQKYNLIKKNIKNHENIEIFSQKQDIESDINYLMNLIKGKFTMIINKFILFDKNEFKKLFSLTNGKIDNIFQTQIHNTSIHLIKSKFLRKLIDNGQLFKNYNIMIDYITSLPKPNLNYINIAMCPNDYYVPLTYVSMISILSSKNDFTFLSFYLIITKDFQKKNVDFLLTLYEQFDYFNITFVEMDDRYKNAFICRRMTIHTYFRFSLGELFPFLNRMLYLDSDIIAYKDLNKLYNLDFNGKMVLGQVTGCNRSKETGIFHINNGILLFNLVLMRKMKIERQVLQILKKKQRLKYHDQTLMNIYFNKTIGIFPLEYNVRNWGTIKDMMDWNEIAGNIYDKDYFYFSQKYPSIRHFLGPHKPTKSDHYHTEDWWFYARRSKYYKKKSFKTEKIFSFH